MVLYFARRLRHDGDTSIPAPTRHNADFPGLRIGHRLTKEPLAISSGLELSIIVAQPRAKIRAPSTLIAACVDAISQSTRVYMRGWRQCIRLGDVADLVGGNRAPAPSRSTSLVLYRRFRSTHCDRVTRISRVPFLPPGGSSRGYIRSIRSSIWTRFTGIRMALSMFCLSATDAAYSLVALVLPPKERAFQFKAFAIRALNTFTAFVYATDMHFSGHSFTVYCW